ncbi:MAG: FecR family protein, partial [Mariniphaga sp.]
KMPDKLLDKFISGKRLTEDEFILLDKLLNNLSYRQELVQYLEKSWQNSESEPVGLQFEQIRAKIRNASIQSKMNRLFIVLSKAAAILFIPILAAALYFYTNQPFSEELLTLSTQKGEHTNVILPDGSKVWLNVDTKLSYPVNYGVKSRDLELEGEAYFEVEKNKELPFEITAGNVTTKALGTRFVISAYPESSEIRSSLVEGSVEVEYMKDFTLLNPGQQLVVTKNKPGFVVKTFDEEYELGWKNNQLIFRLTPFDHVITELEKWYDVNIDYNPAAFKSETLTVRFEQHETLENVLKVISRATGFKYSVEDKNIKITK